MFTTKNEKHNIMTFLDIQIIPEYKKYFFILLKVLLTLQVLVEFIHILRVSYRLLISGIVYKLAYRCFQIIIWIKLHTELLFLKQIFL